MDTEHNNQPTNGWTAWVATNCGAVVGYNACLGLWDRLVCLEGSVAWSWFLEDCSRWYNVDKFQCVTSTKQDSMRHSTCSVSPTIWFGGRSCCCNVFSVDPPRGCCWCWWSCWWSWWCCWCCYTQSRGFFGLPGSHGRNFMRQCLNRLDPGMFGTGGLKSHGESPVQFSTFFLWKTGMTFFGRWVLNMHHNDACLTDIHLLRRWIRHWRLIR